MGIKIWNYNIRGHFASWLVYGKNVHLIQNWSNVLHNLANLFWAKYTKLVSWIVREYYIDFWLIKSHHGDTITSIIEHINVLIIQYNIFCWQLMWIWKHAVHIVMEMSCNECIHWKSYGTFGWQHCSAVAIVTSVTWIIRIIVFHTHLNISIDLVLWNDPVNYKHTKHNKVLNKQSLNT